MNRIIFALIALATIVVPVAAQQTQQQEQNITLTATGTIPQQTVKVEPQTTTVTRRVPQYRRTNRYVNRRQTVTTGYTAVIPAQQFTATVDATQVQTQVQGMLDDQLGPLSQRIGNVEVRVDKVEKDVVFLGEGLNTLNNRVNTQGGRITALEQYTVKNEQNIQALDGRLTNVENRKDKTRSFMDWLNLGLNGVNLAFNIWNSTRISRIQRNQTVINNTGCRPGQYNCPVAGNCLVRGNCNYNNGDGGPIRVRNGSGSSDGNFPVYNNSSGGGLFNNPRSSQIFLGGGSGGTVNTGGGTYNTPRNNGNGGTFTGGGVIFQ